MDFLTEHNIEHRWTMTSTCRNRYDAFKGPYIFRYTNWPADQIAQVSVNMFIKNVSLSRRPCGLCLEHHDPLIQTQCSTQHVNAMHYYRYYALQLGLNSRTPCGCTSMLTSNCLEASYIWF